MLLLPIDLLLLRGFFTLLLDALLLSPTATTKETHGGDSFFSETSQMPER